MNLFHSENEEETHIRCPAWAAGTGIFSVCSAGAAGWAAGAGILSFLDFFALKAEASYMRVHGQKRGTAAKKAVCYNRWFVLKL